MTNRSLPVGAVLLAGFLWGTIGIFVRRYSALGMDSWQIVGIRCVVTVIILFIYLFFFQREQMRIRMKDLWCFVGTGIFSILFFNLCYFRAIVLTNLSVAAVLLYTAPAFVMILSYFLFREPLSPKKGIALVMAFLGCTLVTGILGKAVAVTPAGIACGLGAGFGYALYTIFGRYALDRGYSSMTITFYTFLMASVGVLPFMKLKTTVTALTGNPGMLLFSLFFVLASTVLPYFVYTWGLLYVENGMASIIASIEPVVASCLGVLVFGEFMTLSEMAGIFLVLGSIILCNIR